MDSWSCLRDRDRPARGSEDSLGQELPSGLGPPLLLPHLSACTTTRLRCPVWGPEPCTWRRPEGGVGAGGCSGTRFVPRQVHEEGSSAPDRLTCKAPFTAVSWAGEPSQHGPALLSRTHRDRKEALFAQGACKQLRASQPGRRSSGPGPSHLPGHVQGLGCGEHQWVPNTYLNECDTRQGFPMPPIPSTEGGFQPSHDTHTHATPHFCCSQYSPPPAPSGYRGLFWFYLPSPLSIPRTTATPFTP